MDSESHNAALNLLRAIMSRRFVSPEFYDLMETIRNTNQWMGASALAVASYPAFSMFPNPALEWMAAWGEVTERSFSRMVTKPDWNIPPFVGSNGQDRIVVEEVVVKRDFGDLLHFRVQGRTEPKRKVLLVAPNYRERFIVLVIPFFSEIIPPGQSA